MDAIRIDSVTHLTLHVSQQIHEHGWALVATPYDGLLHHHTLGLTDRLDHQELETFALDEGRGSAYLSVLVDRIKAGRRYRCGDFVSDLVPGFDLFLVENPADPAGSASTDGRLRLVWPDAQHRYPWHSDCEARCARQRFIPPPSDISLDHLTSQLSVLGQIN